MAAPAYTELALNFFFLLLADEALAITAAEQALKSFNKKSDKPGEKNPEVILVHELLATYKKIKKKLNRQPSAVGHKLTKSEWKIPQPKIFSQWKEYLNKTDGEAETVLILRYALKFPTKTIADALNLPEGTVLFRIGRGLEQMSRLR